MQLGGASAPPSLLYMQGPLMGVESYKHKFAKAILLGWLRDGAVYDKHQEFGLVGGGVLQWRVNRGAPHFGVWEEYPITRDFSYVWDEEWDGDGDSLWTERPPTYDELLARNTPPTVIFDIAIQHKGNILYAIEVVHRHGLDDRKKAIIKELFGEHFSVFTVPAEWIMCQVERPSKLLLDRVWL